MEKKNQPEIFILKAITVLVVLFAASELLAAKRSPIKPLLYPVGIITTNEPFIIWKDIYNIKGRKKFKITLKEEKKNSKPVKYIFTPGLYFKYYYAYKLPKPLKGLQYRYKIEMLVNNKPANYKYYYYLRYPIEESFSIDNSQNNSLNDLPIEYFIKYKYFEKENTLINGYNFLFYAASSTISLGAGILFLTVFNFGTISTVIWALCFGSSAAGYSAAGYYAYHYMTKKNEMKEIIKIGTRVSIKGSFGRKKISTKAELSF